MKTVPMPGLQEGGKTTTIRVVGKQMCWNLNTSGQLVRQMTEYLLNELWLSLQ